MKDLVLGACPLAVLGLYNLLAGTIKIILTGKRIQF